MRSLLALSLLSIASVNLMAQAQPSHEIALDYTYLHTNAPPGGCGCFSMNGGSGSYAYHLGPQFATVFEVGAVHASKVDASGLDLTLTSFLLGPRFFYRRPQARFVPYAQVLLGAVRATGGLAPANSGGAASSTVFGSTLGGGVEFNLNRKITLRLAQVDYFVTTFPNKADNHQNNLRFTAGAALHFGKR
ncbi:outer membrane beta-barrel protein [Granulicella sp. WH15]|uniref:outer membrane beta-barrel protein n=1 Tax=Granulicella sp. WH15 TaxID=2602070 RepID=UPI0013A542F3|nr:outer membrane beta-barrel protein [Granulicella sp. WH15]